MDIFTLAVLGFLFVGTGCLLSETFKKIVAEIVASIVSIVCTVVQEVKKWVKSVVCRVVKYNKEHCLLEVYTRIEGLSNIKKKTQLISWNEIPPHIKEKLEYEGESIVHEYYN